MPRTYGNMVRDLSNPGGFHVHFSLNLDIVHYSMSDIRSLHVTGG